MNPGKDIYKTMVSAKNKQKVKTDENQRVVNPKSQSDVVLYKI